MKKTFLSFFCLLVLGLIYFQPLTQPPHYLESNTEELSIQTYDKDDAPKRTTQEISITDITIGEIKVAKSYGCAQTGISLGFSEVSQFQCDLHTQKALITLLDQSQISASLYVTPKNLVSGETGNVELLVAKTSVGATEQALCSLVDEQTGQNMGKTFIAIDNQTLKANCFFKDDTKIMLVYAVYPILAACTPKTIWEASTPTDFELEAPGTYVAELVFPLYTGADAPWVSDLSWTQINSPDLPISFVGAVGRVLAFDNPDCNQSDFLSWQIKNLNSNTNLLVNWKHAGVAK